MCRAVWGSIVAAMTETTTATSPTGATRTLYRDPDDRMFGGVCAAVARYTDTDPVIWRIVAVVLAVFGGTGVALYLVGWLLIPKLGADGSIAESWVSRHRRGRSFSPKGLIILAILGLIVLAGLDDGRGVAAVAVLAVVGYLVYRDRNGDHSGAVLPPTPVPSPPPGPEAPAGWPAPPPPVVRTPRERSSLGLATLSVAALVSGGLVWAALAGADGLTPGRIIAVALLVVGAGLVVGTWYGRARWLIAVGLLLCLGLGTAVAADATGGTLRGGVGARTWVVAPGQTEPGFALGVGEARLDLTDLPSTGPHVVVHAKIGLGHLIIIVPDGVPIRVHAKARIGDITEFGNSLVSGNDHVERTRSYGTTGDPRVEVEATIGTGQIEVRHG
jgi:phage shock protein PspC (stress-responsive transcriptional regulator)